MSGAFVETAGHCSVAVDEAICVFDAIDFAVIAINAIDIAGGVAVTGRRTGGGVGTVEVASGVVVAARSTIAAAGRTVHIAFTSTVAF